MNRQKFITQGIILSRTDYGEADRILTFLTPDHGKVRAIAKGVRKSRSKLAGGIELFSISHISVIVGKTDLHTLASTRLDRHFGNIVKDIERTNAAYEVMRRANRATEDQTEAVYFEILRQALAALDDASLSVELTKLWFDIQLLRQSGHTPNLNHDSNGQKLADAKTYTINLEAMCFDAANRGAFSANHIKLLRLAFKSDKPQVLHRIEDADKLVIKLQPLIQTMLKTYVRI